MASGSSRRGKKPAGRGKKFKLSIRDLRNRLRASEAAADRAVTQGKRKLQSARRRGDRDAVAANLQALADARNARANLTDAVRAMQKACCDQFLNCDPEFF